MTIDEIASFCEFKDCEVSAGDPEVGTIHINGRGIDRNVYTYGRFNMLGEVKSEAAPEALLAKASSFKIRRGDSSESLSRHDFKRELFRFQILIGGV